MWRRLVTLVSDTRDDWRHKMSEATGLPFGRARVLRRLLDRPLTLRELAVVISSDAPATTVLVNDLERRQLIVREPHPTNRRAKLVSLTPEGRALALKAIAWVEEPPPVLKTVDPNDLAAMARVLDAILAARKNPAES